MSNFILLSVSGAPMFSIDPSPGPKRPGSESRISELASLKQYPPEATAQTHRGANVCRTSQATAHVSGVMAFLLHRFPVLKGQPQGVKEIVMRSRRDIFRDKTYQGQGVVSLAAALQLANDRAD